MQTRALVAPVGQRPASVQSQDGPSEIVSSAVKQNATTSPYSQQVCVIKLCKNYKEVWSKTVNSRFSGSSVLK